jgi:hypothetical protein
VSVPPSPRHAQYSVCSLRVKVVSFFFYAPKVVIEAVLPWVIMFAEVDLVVHDVAVV